MTDTRRYLCIWDAGYLGFQPKPKVRHVGIGHFREDMGYDDESIARVEALPCYQSADLSDPSGIHIVVRLADYNSDTVHAEALADEFSHVLRNWLTADEMAKVIERNRAQTNPIICHSHDFCDANMAMDEAFTLLMGRSSDAADGHDARLWNEAWEIAKRNEFAIDGGEK